MGGPESRRVELADGRVSYEIEQIVAAGAKSAHVTIGIVTLIGRPVLPGWPQGSTAKQHGVLKPFLPEAIDIDKYTAPHFRVEAFYGGACNLFPFAPGEGSVPGALLTMESQQPPYRLVLRGLPLVLQVCNTSPEPQAFRVRVVGREHDEERAALDEIAGQNGYGR